MRLLKCHTSGVSVALAFFTLTIAVLSALCPGVTCAATELGSGPELSTGSRDILPSVKGATKAECPHNSLVFTISDIVFFSYKDNTMLELYDPANVLIWNNSGMPLDKGEHAYVTLPEGVYRARGSEKFSVLSGDPITNYVVGYHAMDQNGYGASTEFYTWVPQLYEHCKFIVFAYEDNTNVTVEYTDTGVDIATFTLNKGEHWDIETLNREWLHVTSDKPVSALTCYDQGYFVPSATGRWSGTEFYTYVSDIAGWPEDLTVIAYEDETTVTIRNSETGILVWSGTLDSGEYHVRSFPSGANQFFDITSSKTVTVSVQPWACWTSNYHQGAYLPDRSGRGIGTDLIGSTLNGGYLHILAYKDDTNVSVYNSVTGSLIGSYILNSGESVEANPCNGLWRIISDKDVSACSGYGICSADFAPVEFGIPPLNLEKNDGLGEGECVNAGDRITYTIRYDNCDSTGSTGDVHNVLIVDSIPDEVDFVSASGSGAYDPGTHTVTWEIGTLPAGTPPDSVELVVQVRSGPLPGDAIVNRVTIVNDETTPTQALEHTQICMADTYDIYLTSDDIDFLPEHPFPGDLVSILATVHCDAASGRVDSAEVCFYVDYSIPIATRQIVYDLTPGGCDTVQVPWIFPDSVPHPVNVELDPDDRLAEYNEGNNDASSILIPTVPAVIDMIDGNPDYPQVPHPVYCYIELPSDYHPKHIRAKTIRLFGAGGMAYPKQFPDIPWGIGDYDSDGIPDLMVTFVNTDLAGLVSPDSAALTLTGEVDFLGSDVCPPVKRVPFEGVFYPHGTYVCIELNYNEDHDEFDRGARGFWEYFTTTYVTFSDQLPDVPFKVRREDQVGPHVLSTVSDGPESFIIDMGRRSAEEIYLLGTGTWLAEYLGHDTLWCDHIDHFSFTLNYSDGVSTELFPTMVTTGLQRWGDILYGDQFGYPGVAAGHFEASPTGYYHIYRIPCDFERELLSISMNDKTFGGHFGDYTLMAMTVWERGIEQRYAVPVCEDLSKSSVMVNSPNASSAQITSYLSDPSPNPAKYGSRILCGNGKHSRVSLKIYDASGRTVITLIDDVLKPGEHAFYWDCKDSSGARVVSGIYFCRLATDGYASTKKIIVMK